jgi:uncharacterized cupin superfamily protein
MAVFQDPMDVPARRGSIYPAQHAEGFEGRLRRALTERLGLTQFGVNLTTLEPGAMSSQRHWHAQEDEFVYVVSGELTLVTEDGEQILKPSMAVGFAKGDRNGHHLVNRGTEPATFLEVGTRSKDDDVEYSDIDMRLEKREGERRFVRKNGEPYE